ncbi:MAG: NAD-dependent epimerase/dehydratase family protein [Pseudomonadota bacterium]
MKVAVFGASGFVGNAVVRVLAAAGRFTTLAAIRSAGSAWDLAKDGFTLTPVDILDRRAVAGAMHGCNAVVNCTRGSEEAMLRGLKNLLLEARAAGVTRFIHLSSVAVYGDPPPPQSVREDAPANPLPNSYGALKLAQDEIVAAAHRPGRFETVMLCPPNITGPGAAFLLGLLQALKAGKFALLDEPAVPCSLVDVANLAAAARAALEAPRLPGGRLFIVDDEPASWAELLAGLAPLLEHAPAVPRIDRATLAARRPALAPPPSLGRSLKHLVSSPVREALRRDPSWAKADKGLRRLVARVSWLESHVARWIEGPLPVTPFPLGPDYDWRLCVQQLRGVHHSNQRAKDAIGYQPITSFAGSLRRFTAWHGQACGTQDGDWALLEALE